MPKVHVTQLEYDICVQTFEISTSGIFFFYDFFRYFIPGPNWVATLNAGKGGAHASYYHRANKQVQWSLMYMTSPLRIITEGPI